MISLATSTVTDKVRRCIEEALNENRLGGGRFIEMFETAVRRKFGAKHGIAVTNGSMADMVAIAAMKAMRPDKKEVIVPALTFTAQAAAIIHNGLTPVFVDVLPPEHELYPYQIDASKVEEKINENTLGIMCVHLLGRECDIATLHNIAKRNDVLLMEDCCEAYGGEYAEGGYFGTGSLCGTFSFFPSHTITTGEGGMLITNDDQFAALARKLRNHGRVGDNILDKFHFSHIGFNGKMSNITAAIGCGVAKTAGGVIRKRRENVDYYNRFLNNNWEASSPHCYPFICTDFMQRDLKLEFLEANGVEARKLFSSLPTQEHAYKYLGHKLGDFPVAERIGEQCLFLPVHQHLTEEDLEKICALL